MKYSKSFLIGLLIAGMTLATTWAIRGQFGHEQGAAWAGGIGALVVVLLAKRNDWYPKALRATLAGAIGWGLGGVMSYGVVVGYGHGSDFGNVYYGLMMLFVIGALYGFLGGGLFGLALADSNTKRVDWSRLLVEMVVIALVTYFFVIEQWGWLMTPPRSEMWAACLGLAISLAWYMVRKQQAAALRVAIYAGLGGGFGFAFGNFLQVLGNASQIPFNFWNVMEYSLGFFGGVGMAYGTYTARWEVSESSDTTGNQWFPIVAIALIIPLVVWDQSFGLERLSKLGVDVQLANPESFAGLIQLGGLLLVIGVGGYWVNYFYFQKPTNLPGFTNLKLFFLTQFSLYTLYSWLITGALLSTYRVEQYLYMVNLVIIGWFVHSVSPDFRPRVNRPRQWGLAVLCLMVVVGILAFIAINSHEAPEKVQIRF